jgi:hypothetical protein
MASEPPVTSGSGGMIARIANLLMRPKEEWPRIAAEPMTPAAIMTKWVVPLAAIGPAAGLIRSLGTGSTLNGIAVATPPMYLAVNFALTWALAVLSTWVLGLIVDALAPSFGGQKDPVAALKVAAFGSTAGFLSGIFQIHPMLMLFGIVGLYTFYLIYEGLPVLMKSPRDKSVAYMLVVFVAAVVVMIIAGYVTSLITNTLLPPVPYGYDFRPQ